MKRYADVVSGSFLVLVSIVMLLETRSIRALGIMEFGPKIMPRILSTALLIVGLAIVVTSLVRMKSAPVTEDPKETEGPSVNYKKVAATAALISFYVFSLRPFGFIVTTIIYLFGQFVVLGGVAKRRLPIYGLLSLGVSFGIYYLFYFVFNVLLPPGRVW